MSSTVENFCTWQTEHCYSYDTLLAPDFWGITLAMDHAWNYQRTIDVFDVWGAEIRTARFGDLDLDGGSWAHVSRVSNRLCTNRGFIGGHATGHQHGEKTGLACSGPDAYGKAAIYIDARPAELTATGEGFHDVDQVEWAHAARVAKAVCEAHGAKSGYFTGYQNPGTSYGLACVSQNTANLTATWTELDATGWRVDGVVQTGYAQALRAANGFCATRGFRTGFLTGRQTGASYGVTCQR
jgi:hypothetical protein